MNNKENGIKELIVMGIVGLLFLITPIVAIVVGLGIVFFIGQWLNSQYQEYLEEQESSSKSLSRIDSTKDGS